MNSRKVDSREFYSEYHGHKVQHLESILSHLRLASDSIIWTAGDSSLDNKYWISESAPSEGAYAQVLRPPCSKCDITYWINKTSLQMKSEKCENQSTNKWGVINTAIEGTTLNQRVFKLLPQDEFLRDNIRSDDILIVSVGGNDIALAPTPCTIISVAGLLCLPYSLIENGCVGCSVPVDDYCCGCSTSLISCLGSFPPCLGYIQHLFGVRVEKYIEKLTMETRPKKILVCMIYYLDENQTPSWAGGALRFMGYNKNPSKLQMIIRKLFIESTSRIQIPGCEVIPVPLFHVLNGKNSSDYVERVEPSNQGGKKIAEYLLDIITHPPHPESSMLNDKNSPMRQYLHR